MAKVKITGINEVQKKIESTFKKVRESQSLLTEIGEFTVSRIAGDARRGKPLNKKRSFPALKKTTVAIRDALAKTNSVHPVFKPSRSNLTITGQLIDALKFVIKKNGVVLVEVDNSPRTPYRTRGRISAGALKSLKKSSKFLSKTKTTGQLSPPPLNSELDKDLRKRGFELYTTEGLRSDVKVLSRINRIVKTFVRRAIKVNFGR